MCIIAAKFRGLELPSYERMCSMFDSNPDGAGFMFNNKGKVIIKKGFMTFDSFIKELEKCDNKYNLQERDLVMHFRYATHGGCNEGLTHPFTVNKSFNDMKKLNNKVDIAVCHNGVYPIKTEKGISDSMVFIKDNILPMYYKDKEFYNDTIKMKSLYRGGNKLVFLTKDGIKLLGTGFIEDEVDGIIYSNESYCYYDDYMWEQDYYYDDNIYNIEDSFNKDGNFSEDFSGYFSFDGFYEDYASDKIEEYGDMYEV